GQHQDQVKTDPGETEMMLKIFPGKAQRQKQGPHSKPHGNKVAQLHREAAADERGGQQGEHPDGDLDFGGTELFCPKPASFNTNTTTAPMMRLSPKPPMK
ncbi:MAG: hypothetical protein ABSD40_25435, partial [Streptosporangiaceae bacterium]